MKKFFSVVFLVSCFNLFATEVRVDHALCGEIDPINVGDACVLLVTAPANSKVGLLFDHELENQIESAIDTLVGETIEINFNLVKKIKNRKVSSALNELLGEEYYFMSASLDSIEL
jgi:hypothetical protein